MKSRTIWIVAGLLLAGVLGAGGIYYWRQSVATAARERAFNLARQSAAAGRWVEARAIVEDQTRKLGRAAEPATLARWRELEFKIAGGLRDFGALEALAGLHPALIATDESSALWLWRLRRAARDDASAAAVRELWLNRRQDPVGWLCAEVDGLVSRGQRDDAKALLATSPVSGAAAVPLILRRALLADRPQEVVRAFDEAYRQDPTNADLRSLRAAALESLGQPAFARVEYVAALLADRTNPLRRDDLASFYLRQGDLTEAVRTWREGLGPLSPDFQWERALFWGRVLGLDAPDASLAGEARRTRYAGWLAAQPADRFWDQAGYAALYLPATHEQQEPSVAWLRILEFVRTGDFAAMATALQQAPAAAVQSAPSLHAALRLTLAVRAGARPAETGIAWAVARGTGHRWWDVLGAAARGEPAASEELIAVARGPLAVPAALLAAGWTGPAVALADWTAAAQPGTPVWLRFSLLQARRMVEGPARALAWAEQLPAAPETDLIRAQLQLAAGQLAAATATLRSLSTRADDTGYAAGWTLAVWELEQGKPDEAERTVAASPQLQQAVLGSELRARAALAARRTADARKIYEEIAGTSLEAGAFLAREAYARKDWAEARRHTDYWLARLPDNMQLRANLAEITSAERAGSKP
jgi:hypothetical protein